MKRKTPDLKPGLKLWLSSKAAQGVFGDGKCRLLQAIENSGSLRAASDQLGISYRKAWGDLKKAEYHLKTPLVRRQRGGSAGGGTGLTEQGKAWLKAYSAFHADIEKAVEKAFAKNIGKILK